MQLSPACLQLSPSCVPLPLGVFSCLGRMLLAGRRLCPAVSGGVWLLGSHVSGLLGLKLTMSDDLFSRHHSVPAKKDELRNAFWQA